MKTDTTTRVILTKPEDWDFWLRQLQARIDETIHPIVFEDRAPKQAPERPEYSSFGNNANVFTDLSAGQQKTYMNALSDFESRQKEFLAERKLITAARAIFAETVSKVKLLSLDEDESPYTWFKRLEKATAPAKGYMLERIKRRYSDHISATKKTFPEWIDQWEEIMQQAKRYFLNEALTGQWLRDLAAIIRPYSDGYATIFRDESRKLDAAAAVIQERLYHSLPPGATATESAEGVAAAEASEWTLQFAAHRFREIIEFEQQQQRQKTPGVKRGAGFHVDGDEDDQRPSKKKKKTRCLGCGSTRHGLSDCWSIFEELRPPHMPKNESLIKRAQKALKEDASLQKKKSADYPLKNSTLLDSGASLHICNNLSRFRSFRKARADFLITGDSEVRIEGYGRVDVTVTAPDGSKRKLRLKKVAYCPTFSASLVSFQLLRDEGIFWDTFPTPTRLVHKSRRPICVLFRVYQQFVLDFRPIKQEDFDEAAFLASKPRRKGSRDPRPTAVADADLWHARLGHLGPMALYKLGQRKGLRIKGPKTAECEICAQGRARRQVSRRPPTRERSYACEEIWIDWTDLAPSHDEEFGPFLRVMFITDAFSGMVFPYFLRTYQEKHNWAALRDFVSWMKLRFDCTVRNVRSDGELFTKKIRNWLRKKGISAEPSAPNTQAQNGGAERFGGIVIEKARKMRIAAKLPHDLWKETVEAACYVWNRTPRAPRPPVDLPSQSASPSDPEDQQVLWKTPLELFTRKDQPEQHKHLRAYGCRAYAMTADAQLGRKKLQKLDPRAHIGYLVGYNSTNIFRIWIPQLKKVISTRDVIFDERTFFDGKREQEPLLESINQLVQQISIPESQQKNQEVLDEETDLESQLGSDDEDEVRSTIFVRDESPEPDEEEEDEEEDDGALKRAKELEEASYLTPPEEESYQSILSVFLPVSSAPKGVGAGTFHALGPSVQVGSEEPFEEPKDRFEDFFPKPIEDGIHGAFTAGRLFKAKARPHKKDLPDLPQTLRQLEKHPFREEFTKAQRDHLQSHEEMGTFEEVPWKKAAGKQVLGCKWVFVYKTDKHGFLQKCKARLVVCGNQQKEGDLPTRATTLAGLSFRALMAIAAEYDLELEQMDAVNAFVNSPIDEVVFIRMPPGFTRPGRVLLLRKALYGLRRSPLLWQQHLTGSLEALGFEKVPQEPCVMRKAGVLVFFYVDDFIWAYRKEDKEIAKEAMAGLQQRYRMSLLGEPRWFLGIHILRDRARKTIWLTQDAYIEKITHKLIGDPSLLSQRFPDTPMQDEELVPAPIAWQASQKEVHQFQQKVGSILFAAISTRPDIAFAVSRLGRQNQNPDSTHQMAADRVLLYLFATKSYGIRLGGGEKEAEIFVCSSDSSFADNSLDRKSSQGYVMTLFGGPIAWRASKQATVATSSTEAEFLAISEAAKEAIFLSRLLQSLQIQIPSPLKLECDNTQTIRLLEGGSKLSTRLRHVDIHQHWLRQEIEEGRIRLHWVPTAQMKADGLTKALPLQKLQSFQRLIGIVDLKDRLWQEARLETLRDWIAKRDLPLPSCSHARGPV
ncbi:hypothetical protein HIM_06271 [Hirsutella minnesotensis 3608]|uniref:Integrase catalytic domain-containing protein n=1 Tax=Hirsutella minnesotensis 3608 TaxID=1043627 RepID=A0A0F7ZNS6_9HYPO|nr:hypothetical protein HIM_08763 [Hirsutella minnesotensis 3608]KJZ72254.1 hypothetical protein HIM_08396 [Hirsutella minnesotensis 3608]KJZ72255.1 hypothetical protein HIM_08397 [Hirsutella minnesotensis 3608]KJZ72341.1 hypothetical protein HIM_08267 [Hirsutella minnesotensis 3608]KJZ72700.1 hypothetical protein HIM_07892 [Hirsutella minnesotensis 3608]